MRKHVMLWTVIVAFVAVTATFVVAQQVKKVRNATITAGSLDYDWDAGTVQFSGGAKIVLSGEYDGTMTAPSMSVKLGSKPERLTSVVATGPVNFTIVTKANAEGVRRKIVATAQKQVTYDDATQLIKMTGSATADLMPQEGGEPVEAIHFAGETITANLKTSRLIVDNANLTVQTAPE